MTSFYPVVWSVPRTDSIKLISHQFAFWTRLMFAVAVAPPLYIVFRAHFTPDGSTSRDNGNSSCFYPTLIGRQPTAENWFRPIDLFLDSHVRALEQWASTFLLSDLWSFLETRYRANFLVAGILPSWQTTYRAFEKPNYRRSRVL